MRDKLSLFCDVAPEAVIEGRWTPISIYELPLIFEEQGLGELVAKRLGLDGKPDHSEWEQMVSRLRNPDKHREDRHGRQVHGAPGRLHQRDRGDPARRHRQRRPQVEVTRVDSEEIEKEGAEKLLAGVSRRAGARRLRRPRRRGQDHGDQVRPREQSSLPGLCLGMQCAVIEFARSVCGWGDANSTEFNPKTEHPVLDLLPGQKHDGREGRDPAAGRVPDADHARHRGAQGLRHRRASTSAIAIAMR